MNPNEALKEGGRTGTSTGKHRLRRILVVAEFALALTLLAAAGLAMHSFRNVTQVDLGIRKDHILTFFFRCPRSAFTKAGGDQSVLSANPGKNPCCSGRGKCLSVYGRSSTGRLWRHVFQCFRQARRRPFATSELSIPNGHARILRHIRDPHSQRAEFY